MPGPYYVTVGTATPTVSAAFALESADKALVVEVPSLMAGGELRPQFSSTSGGPFWPLQRPDGSGLPYAVHSGAGPAIAVLERPPAPWGRFLFTGSLTLVATLTLNVTR